MEDLDVVGFVVDAAAEAGAACCFGLLERRERGIGAVVVLLVFFSIFSAKSNKCTVLAF